MVLCRNSVYECVSVSQQKELGLRARERQVEQKKVIGRLQEKKKRKKRAYLLISPLTHHHPSATHSQTQTCPELSARFEFQIFHRLTTQRQLQASQYQPSNVLSRSRSRTPQHHHRWRTHSGACNNTLLPIPYPYAIHHTTQENTTRYLGIYTLPIRNMRRVPNDPSVWVSA